MRLTSPSIRRNNGFTLIEVLVAVTIGAIVLALVYSSLFQIIKTKERVEETNLLTQEVRILFSRIEKDLANAYPRGQLNRNAVIPQTYFLGTREGNNSRLAFTSFSRDTLYEDNQSDETEITYFLRQNENREGVYYLFRRDNPYPGNENSGLTYPISENVSRFEIFYTDESSFDITRNGRQSKIKEWNSAQIGSLPRAVEVSITLIDESGNKRDFSSIFIIPAGNN